MNFTNDTVMITVYLSLFIQIVTTFYSFKSLKYEVSEENKILKDILKLELVVQLIESTFYIWVVYSLKNFKNITKNRNNDWFITTPTMLISSVIFFKYQEYKEKNEKQNIVFLDFLKENSNIIKKILIFNGLMLLFGYLGETNKLNKELSIAIGFVFFFLSFKTIYDEYAQKSVLGKKLFTLLSIVWGLYGVAAFYDRNTKNIMYNSLDVVAKNFFGLYISYKIKNLSPQTL